ncbi:PadR family transcriptional regulator [Sphingomicrobium sp. B8]|uniref:PadR family transcriptional regulator n=2 Tax=Sphingomicrobium clamense TaxID=2851013 RepID=A0ABS6V7Z9_9SPHN|nr:PadR family transcriptional regulator [Sphingomicrobium sp. B8]
MKGGKGFDMDFGPGGFTFHLGGDRHRHRHRHRSRARRARMFDSGELRLVILHLLAEEARHGYDVIRALEEMTGGAYAPSPGTVYPTLTLLEDMGLIEEREPDGKKRLFAATKDGKKYLKDRAEEVEALLERLEGHGERQHKAHSDTKPIKPAVKRLMKAFWMKMAETNGDEETLEKIAAIVNKAAKKIEKI